MNKSKKCTGLCWRCQFKEHGCVWPHTEMFAAHEALKIAKANTEYLVVPVAKILVRAAEKQIPMPLKVQSIPQGKYNFPQREVLYFVMKHFYCQNCGHEMLKNYYGDLASVKYCPHCGQKLWWPKN